ncbi:Ig-like domain-containing protein [uncultured Massilia sp.]|uniref:Ig-like domain-containing protein n=1 Tax=uncultured Massilia sp. TaxID=169973 RepID=UPI00258FF491|nr:Ig-like domain-containing protein [uncultured Massilia sp.]
MSTASSTVTSIGQARQVVFIDANISGYNTLVQQLSPNMEVVVLDPRTDGLAQIAAWCADVQDLGAIHIVSHGRPGAVQLGGVELSGATLGWETTRSALNDIGASLAPGGQLLLYGCATGAGLEGAAFVAQLAQFANATVGASDDNTGAASLGGDWDIEVVASPSGAGPQIGGLARLTGIDAYEGLLAGTVVAENVATVASGRDMMASPAGTTPLQVLGGIELSDGKRAVLLANAPNEYYFGGGPNLDNLQVAVVGTDGSVVLKTITGAAQTAISNNNGTPHYSGHDQTNDYARITALKNGGFVVTSSSNDGYGVQLFDNNGNSVANASPFTGSSVNPTARTLATPDGGYVVFWTMNNLTQVNFQRYDSLGQAVGSKVSATGSSGTNFVNPNLYSGVAIDEKGNIAISYSANDVFTPSGVRIWSASNTLVAQPVSAYYQQSAVISAKAGGGFALFGNDIYSGNFNSSDAYHVQYLSEAGSLSAVTQNVVNLPSSGSGGDVQLMADGNYLVNFGSAGAYVVSGTAPNAATSYQLISAADGAKFATGPVVDGDGSITAAWYSDKHTTDYGTVTDGTVQVVSYLNGPTNAAPTLTTVGTVPGGAEDAAKTITFSGLAALANEADSDGTVTAFVVKAVSSGVLKIGADAASATAWAAGSNDVIDATHQAFWTPAANANGAALNAFTVVARDDGGLQSATPVQVKVEVAAVNDAPTLSTATTLTTIAEDVPSADVEDVSDTTNNPPPNWGDDVNDLLNASGYADVDGDAWAGIAISGNAANPVTEGRWQYSTDEYSTFWHDVGAVSPGAALLLSAGSSATTFLRFVPVADYHGRPGSLTVHAVQQSNDIQAFSSWDGATETRITWDTANDGGTSPVSASGVTWSVDVTSVDDKAVITNFSAADSQTVAASAGAVAVDLGADAVITDIDSADFRSGALTIDIINRQPGDVLAFKTGGAVTLSNGVAPNSSVFVDGVRVGFIDPNGSGAGNNSLAVIFDTTNATPARATALLRAVTFDTTGNVAGVRNINVTVNDGDGEFSHASTAITVTTNPSVAISSDLAIIKAGASATISFTFSDAPTGVETGDFTVTGGTLGALVQDGQNPLLYTAVFTPATGFTGSGSVSIAAGKFTDGSGNGNDASTSNAAFTVDTVAPGLSITSDKAALAAGQTATITFTFSEAPAAFSDGAITASGGTLSSLAASADPNIYTAVFTPAANTASVAGQISVAAGAYTDVAGNNGGAASVSLGGDTLAPTLSIGTASATLKAGEQTTLTFTFSEAPAGFTQGDVTVTGGSLSGFAVSADPKVYTATFTPIASNTLAASVSVAAGAYADAIGNAGAASNTVAIGGDTQAPSVTITSDRTVFKAGQGATLTFTFDETPVGFDSADIVASGGTVGALAATGDSKVFTATFTPTDSVNVLAGGIRVAGGGVMDAAGNLNPASNLLSISGDTRAPVVTDAHLSIAGATGSGGAFKAGDTITASWDNGAAGDANPDVATVTFDLSAFGGSATASATLVGGVWSASHTIAAGSVDATNRNVGVAVTDAAGNATTLADTSNATLDNQAPTVSAGAILLSGATGTGGVFRIGDTITASWNGEANADIASGAFDFGAFGGGVVAATQNAGVWSASYTIAAGAVGASGLAVSLTAVDDAGNSRTQAGSATAALDAVRPSVTSISVVGTPGPAATSVDFTVTFSEAVNGVDLADFALATTGQASGTLANISGSGTTWTVTVDGIAGRGTVGLNLKAVDTGITDGAGNAIGAGFTGAVHASGINAVPVISSNGGGNTAAIELAEGLTAVTTVIASDGDNDLLTYTISGGVDAALFGIGADGKLRFLQAPSAAARNDANHDGIYDVVVTAADAFGGADTQSIAVTVLRDIDADGLPDIHDDDIDNDGRPNSAEDPVPGAFGVTGDGNGDGIADSLQTNVASLATVVAGNPFATLEVGGNYTLTSVSAGPVPTGLPRNVKLPLGQLDFTINDVTPGGTVEVAIYVDAAQKVNSYFKLDNTGKWVNIAKSVTTVGTKTKITFDLKDGGPLDSDGVANGRIVDPGGVALVTPLITSNGGTLEAAISLVEGSRAVTTATASIPVTWSLGGADAALFQVDAATGAVSFRNAPSYGQPLDNGGTPHDNVYVLDLIASDANGSDTQTLKVTVQQYVAPPVTPPAPVTVDGVPVTTGTVVNGDGRTSTTISIPVVVPTRPEQVGNNTVADIPLATNNGTQILTAQIPTGLGLQVASSGVQTAGTSLTDLIREIKAHTQSGSHDQNSLTGGGSGFLSDLAADTPLLVQTIVPTVTPGSKAPGEALVLSGSPASAGGMQTALVIDTSGLGSGAAIQLHNVEFAAIIGAATVTGGTGSQKVWGDSASQTLFLGEDDDVLHGGGGDDIVGSAGGNDRIFGDEGNDIVFGGAGNDYIDGGAGTDTIRLMGASRAEYTMRIKDGAVVMTHLKSDADGIDTVVSVELLQYAGQTGTVDFNKSEIADLVRLYSTAFGRNADTGGINFWIDKAEQGMSLMQLAHFFMASAEGKADFGALSNHDFVTKLYDVAMHRTASANEVDFWTNHLDRGALDRGEVLYYFATSEEKAELVGVVNTSITTT